MKKQIIFSLVIITLMLSYACKKSDSGGKATVTANVYHEGKPIAMPTVYVKFDATDPPKDPTNNYDLKIEAKHDNHVHIKELRYGNYYLYSVGFDSSIMRTVSGGVPLSIRWKDRNKEVDVNIHVGH
jgi:hypothetical protein